MIDMCQQWSRNCIVCKPNALVSELGRSYLYYAHAAIHNYFHRMKKPSCNSQTISGVPTSTSFSDFLIADFLDGPRRSIRSYLLVEFDNDVVIKSSNFFPVVQCTNLNLIFSSRSLPNEYFMPTYFVHALFPVVMIASVDVWLSLYSGYHFTRIEKGTEKFLRQYSSMTP